MKYTCELCEYATENRFNFKVHSNTSKHLQRVLDHKKSGGKSGGFRRLVSSTTPPKSNTGAKTGAKSHRVVICDYCHQTISTVGNRARHYRRCNKKKLVEQQKIIEKLTLEKEMYKKIATVGRSNNITINNDNRQVNDNRQMTVFHVHNNYTEAYNYEDVMEPSLTKKELRHAKKYGLSAACEKVITDRCITNITKEKRPFHCVDAARKKFIVRTEDEWKEDIEAKELLEPAFNLLKDVYSDEDKQRMSENQLMNVNNQLSLMYQGGAKKTIKALMHKSLLKNNN